MALEVHMIGCDCGCDCCEPTPESPEEERKALLRQREIIEARLKALQKV
jgi:hypothetical protein